MVRIGECGMPTQVASRLRLVSLQFLALAQIVLGGPHRRARLGVGIEILLGHHGDAAVLAHLDDVETPRRAFEHPVLALKLCGDALERSTDAAWLGGTAVINTHCISTLTY